MMLCVTLNKIRRTSQYDDEIVNESQHCKYDFDEITQ